MRTSRAGIVLVLVSALLALLALLAAALTAASRSGRDRMRTHVLHARAALLARSGVERAVHAAGRHPFPRRDRDRSNNWRCEDPIGTRLEDSRNPSLHHPRLEPWLDDGDGVWEGEGFTDLNQNGRYDGASGRLRGTLWEAGDTYTLRVEDESAKINVNGGFLDDEDRDGDDIPDHRDPDVRENPSDPKDTGRGWNFQLARILDVLGTAGEDFNGNGVLDGSGQYSEDWNGNGRLDPLPIGVAGLGASILRARPEGGYPSVEEVRRVVSADLGVPLPDLSPYLTVSSWIDHSVVHPNGTRPDTRFGVPRIVTQSDIMKGRCPLRLEEGGRPPVNLNAADPHVLFALLYGLEAMQTGDPVANDSSLGMMRSRVFGVLSVPNWSSSYARHGLWRYIHHILLYQRGSALRTWQDFMRWDLFAAEWLDHMAHDRGMDLFSANFDPNTRLNKHEPDQVMWRRCDKTDLIVWSTEGSLGPTGTFRIRSLGRVAEADGGVTARADLDVTTEVFTPLRQTTQADFMAGRRPDASDTSCLSLAPPSVHTTGSAPACSWNTWAPGRGLSVVTYPAPPSALPARASDMDGNVALATTEVDHEEFEPGMPLTFAHHFDDSWDADVGGDRGLLDGAYTSLLQRDVAADVWPAAPQEPNTLCPDGAHSQHGRSPAYRAAGNLPMFGGAPSGNHAAVSFWTRSVGCPYRQFLGPACVAPDRILLSLSQFGVPPPQNLRVGRISSYWLFDADSWMPSGGSYVFEYDQVQATQLPGPMLEDCRWRLVTIAFDTNEAEQAQQMWMGVGFHGGTRGGGFTRIQMGFDPADARDILAADGHLVLGPSWEGADRPGAPLPPPAADVNQMHLVDEVAVYDLGDDGATAMTLAAQMLEQGLDAGRYYKGDDGRFLSAVLEPAPGRDVRLLWTAWTAFHPSETRFDLWPSSTGLPKRYTSRNLDPALERARVEVDLMEEDGTTVLQPLVQWGGQVDRSLGRFRYRVRFVNGLTELGIDPLNQGVLESPWFDDITFYVQPASGPRSLAWRQG